MGRGAELPGPVRVDVVGWLLALLLPTILWHGTVGQIAQAFHWELRYLITGWAPWLLMLGGLGCFVPVIVDRVKDPERRFYGSQRSAWFGWSVTLYLLGFGLATQVGQITAGFSSI
jgi:hypothetical protein